MEIALAVLSGLLLFIGLLGAILPVLPGPIISWVGILILHFTDYAEYTTTFLVVSALIVIAITVLDYLGNEKVWRNQSRSDGVYRWLNCRFVLPAYRIGYWPLRGRFGRRDSCQ